MLLPTLAVFGISISAAVAADWTNVTVYRTTPINYTGVANMDTGDSGGDAMFGLNQLRCLSSARGFQTLGGAQTGNTSPGAARTWFTLSLS